MIQENLSPREAEALRKLRLLTAEQRTALLYLIDELLATPSPPPSPSESRAETLGG